MRGIRIYDNKVKKIEMVISVWRRDVVWRHVIMKSSRRHHYYNPYQLIGGEVPSAAYYPVLRPSYYWVQPQLGSYYQQQMPYIMPGNTQDTAMCMQQWYKEYNWGVYNEGCE